MKIAFKIASICWIVSPFVFAGARLLNLINIYHQNITIGLVLAFASTICLFLNYETEE